MIIECMTNLNSWYLSIYNNVHLDLFACDTLDSFVKKSNQKI